VDICPDREEVGAFRYAVDAGATGLSAERGEAARPSTDQIRGLTVRLIGSNVQTIAGQSYSHHKGSSTAETAVEDGAWSDDGDLHENEASDAAHQICGSMTASLNHS
jgi:hypothetical protein